MLDTNVEPAAPDPSEAVLTRLRRQGGEVALPSVAWHELTYGAERMDEGRRRSYLVEYLHEVVHPSMPVLPCDATAAQWHGWARAALEEKGLSTPFADGQIAAIAATEDVVFVTKNVADFEPSATLEDGIRLENWFSG